MKTVINIKADKEVKDQAFKVAAEMGLPLSTIVNAFLKQFIREKRVTFEVPLVPNKKTAKLLREADEDIRLGRNLSGPFETVEEFIADLKRK
jgi:addiction module RelB/DinJ family antitoxin